MSLLLNIDTAVENASICISKDGLPLGMMENKNQKDHAGWIHPAIDELMKKTGYRLNDINAIAVSNGPGSYTGLRVSLATAKGLCYGLNIPLITLSTLKVMTVAARSTIDYQLVPTDLLSPLVDARRMEVFTALYDKDLKAIQPPHARIIDEKSFRDEFVSHRIIFYGNGAEKCKPYIQHPNAIFKTVECNASSMIGLAEAKMKANDFADIAYAEPFYIKDFHSTQPKT